MSEKKETRPFLVLNINEEGKLGVDHIEDLDFVFNSAVRLALGYKLLYLICRYVVFNACEKYEKKEVANNIYNAKRMVENQDQVAKDVPKLIT